MPRKKSVKKKSSKKKLLGLTKIPKGNARKLKAGYALVYGSKSKPSFGTKRFKTISSAKKYVQSKKLL